MSKLIITERRKRKVIPIQKWTWVQVTMRPQSVYAAVATALGRPHYGAFPILQRVLQ